MEKIIYFDGVRFCLDEKTGYYHGYIRERGRYDRLHRYIYEFYHGKLPSNYDVHHKDFDKNNNDISNLIALSRSEHLKIHGEAQTEEQRQAKRDNLTNNVRPKASEWHGSEAGREWHKKHYEKMKDALYRKKNFLCKNCGKEFSSTKQGFCSNACKSAYRRKMGFDNVARKCAVCGKEFIVNKYAKTCTCSIKCRTKLSWTMKRRAIANS